MVERLENEHIPIIMNEKPLYRLVERLGAPRARYSNRSSALQNGRSGDRQRTNGLALFSMRSITCRIASMNLLVYATAPLLH